jgi:hypothetical protein
MGQEFLIDTNAIIDYMGGSITLISRNTKDFKNIEGLEVINPYEL